MPTELYYHAERRGSFESLAVAASEEVERRVIYYCCHRHVFGEHVAVAYAYLVGKLALRALERVEHLLLVVVSRQLLERVCQLVPQQQHVVPTAERHVERRGDERRESKTAQGASRMLVLLVAYSLRVLPYGQAEFHAERLNYAEFVAYARPYVFRHAYVRLCALQPHCVINAYVQRGCLPLRLLGANDENGKKQCPYGAHFYNIISCKTLFHRHKHVFKVDCNLIE